MSKLKKQVRACLRNEFVWWPIRVALGPFASVYVRLKELRGAELEPTNSELHRRFDELAPGRVVRNGPFKGMEYPTSVSTGSTYFSKILGSYERELHETLQKVATRRYSVIVDVGCAEGYYAVGLGRLFPDARVLAYDTNATARELCAAMAEHNGVAVEVGGFLDRDALLELDLGARALIVLDCEGYERELVDDALAGRLSNHDFLIECHDQVHIDITQKMQEAFADSHDSYVVHSVDDISKAYDYDYPELEGCDLTTKRHLLAEGRPVTQRWHVAISRAAS